MPLIKLYFSPALVLLMVSCLLWQHGKSLTIPRKHLTHQCVLDAAKLLKNITNVLSKDELFRGINCTTQSVELSTTTNTAFLCSPKVLSETRIFHMEESCLTNIEEDLRQYYKFLATHPEPTLLIELRQFMEDCFPWSLFSELPSAQAAAVRDSTFNERQRLCKVLKGFHVRTITINRAFAYINSFEHNK
uniref:Zmp:0000001127 n=1 Tax=Echeneis naucrates TaxID=173247 RepID=A0A665TII7_ECHNA